MAKRLNIKNGDKFGRLTIVCEVDRRKKQRRFMCICDCGVKKEISLVLLRNGQTKSCGCFKREHLIKTNTRHGKSPRGKKNKLYAIWVSMKQRCFNPKCSAYKFYGNRGIKINPSWLDFEKFELWAVTNGYKEGLSIERSNVNGNYEPINCTWIPRSDQSNNTRRSTFYEFNGKKQTLKDWSTELEMNYMTLWGRVHKKDWTVKRAFTEPIHEERSNMVKSNGI